MRPLTYTDVGIRTGWLLTITLLLSACNPLQEFGGLEEQVQAYYRAEQSGDWAQVYELRVRDFRWSVSRDYFVKAMTEDARGWELLDYSIESAEAQGDQVQVTLDFRYRITGEKPAWQQLANTEGILEVSDTSVWLYEDGRWLCKDAGVRHHLPMNDPLD
ncbi:MAG: nuclear transport factor 2 family protein [Gammaproteobacteria bacterium]|nr:nuclear transport factor 2 family protein [Gammaproteobacteria bacterium]MBU2478312.1 nuclear transport factor 2 family protein [Gammaproteobacteria bacterium]